MTDQTFAVTNADDLQPQSQETAIDPFVVATGMTRQRAHRVTTTLLMQIGSVLPDGLSIPQQLGAAINILGAAIAEVVSGTNAPKPSRDELIGDLNRFVLTHTDELVAYNESLRQQAAFVGETVAMAANSEQPTKTEIN